METKQKNGCSSPDHFLPLFSCLLSMLVVHRSVLALKDEIWREKKICQTFLSFFSHCSSSKQLPSYKNFKGVIHELGQNQYLVSGEVSVIDRNTIEITELPVRTWTQVQFSLSSIGYLVLNFSPLIEINCSPFKDYNISLQQEDTRTIICWLNLVHMHCHWYFA